MVAQTHIVVSASAKTPTAAREPARPGTLPGTPSFDGVQAPDGTSFAQFRRTLEPRYARAWLDLAARWMFLGGGFAAMCVASARLGVAAAWLVVPGAVWIGANTVILPGIAVADGTIVSAGAVVTQDTAPYTIVGGVPARPIGERPREAASPALPMPQRSSSG